MGMSPKERKKLYTAFHLYIDRRSGEYIKKAQLRLFFGMKNGAGPESIQTLIKDFSEMGLIDDEEEQIFVIERKKEAANDSA